MALGILDQLGLAASLVFAIPVALYGLQQAVGGTPLVGAAFVVVAALMVYLPHRLTTPGDIPGKAAEKAVGTAIGSDDEEGDYVNGDADCDGSDGDYQDDDDANTVETDGSPTDAPETSGVEN